jgi:hypothetical protein
MPAATLATIPSLNMIDRGEYPLAVFHIIMNTLHQTISGCRPVFSRLCYPCLILL